MRLPNRVLVVVGISLSYAGCRPAPPAEEPAPAPSYQLIDAMPAFWHLMGTMARHDDATWLAAYREQIIEPHSDVFSLARRGLDDNSLVRFRGGIVRNAVEYRATSDSLPARLARQWTRFVRAFPDTKPGAVLYILPAPPSAVGGWFRPLADRDVVVFGLDLLASARTEPQFGIRVSHELVHLYHAQVNPQIHDVVTTFFMGRGQHATALHELMWIEGFAVYASLQITPGAQRTDVMSQRLLSANDAARGRSARAIRERLAVTDRATVEALVYDGAEALPPQAVNYIGLVVAERLAKRYSLSAMARLDGSALSDAIRRELEEIEATAR